MHAPPTYRPCALFHGSDIPSCLWPLAAMTMRPGTMQKWSKDGLTCTHLNCWCRFPQISIQLSTLKNLPPWSARSHWDDHFMGEAESKPQCCSSEKGRQQEVLLLKQAAPPRLKNSFIPRIKLVSMHVSAVFSCLWNKVRPFKFSQLRAQSL